MSSSSIKKFFIWIIVAGIGSAVVYSLKNKGVKPAEIARLSTSLVELTCDPRIAEVFPNMKTPVAQNSHTDGFQEGLNALGNADPAVAEQLSALLDHAAGARQPAKLSRDERFEILSTKLNEKGWHPAALLRFYKRAKKADLALLSSETQKGIESRCAEMLPYLNQILSTLKP